MDFIQKYWWILLLGVIAVIFFSRSKASAASSGIQQIGGDQVQLATIASAARQADEQNRVGLIGTFLAYLQGKDTLAASATAQSASTAASIRIAELTSNANALIASQQISSQNYLGQQSYAAQLAALQAQAGAQTQAGLFHLISSGLGTFLPLLLGGFHIGGGGGGSPVPYTTPPFNPGGSLLGGSGIFGGYGQY